MQLGVGNRALEDFAFTAAQGQQNAAIRACLGGDVEVGEQRSEFFLDQAHVYQLRVHMNGKHGGVVAVIVPVSLSKKILINQ
ncbi:hypothetical protein D3C76_1545080 [compost metagenome]